MLTEPPMTRCPHCDVLVLPPDLMTVPHVCVGATDAVRSTRHRGTRPRPTLEDSMPTYYAFNTGDKIRPTDIHGTGKFQNQEDGGLLLVKVDWRGQPGKTPLMLTGHKHQGCAEVGDIVRLVADQTGRMMGDYRVMAGVDADGKYRGVVKDTLVKHYVMK